MHPDVSDRLVLGEGGRRTIELYPVTDNPHAETMLMAYFPRQRLLAEVDLYTPPAPNATDARFPFVASLVRNSERRGLRVDRVLALHGRVVQFEDLRDAVRVASETTTPFRNGQRADSRSARMARTGGTLSWLVWKVERGVALEKIEGP